MDIVLTPLIAFCIYLLLASILSGLGRQMAPVHPDNPFRSAAYASGEASPARPALSGYREFSLAALFFGLLHMGVLILATAHGVPLQASLYALGFGVTLSFFLAQQKPDPSQSEGGAE